MLYKNCHCKENCYTVHVAFSKNRFGGLVTVPVPVLPILTPFLSNSHYLLPSKMPNGDFLLHMS